MIYRRILLLIKRMLHVKCDLAKKIIYNDVLAYDKN